MAASPAIAGSILRNFSIIGVTMIGGVFAVYETFSIANKKQMTEGVRGQLGLYNANPQPEQDRLDTIFDRTKIMNTVKDKKPWNKTSSEKERVHW